MEAAMEKKDINGIKISETAPLLEELRKMGAAAPAGYTGTDEEYLAAIRNFLEGQEFLRLGHCLNRKQWELAMLNIGKLKKHVNQLGITCFDRSLVGLREAAAHRNRNDALQIMAQITAKRVKLRTVMGTMRTMGSAGKNFMGSAEESIMGSAGKNFMGSTEESIMGNAGKNFMGSAEESIMGNAGKNFMGSTEESIRGSAGKNFMGSAEDGIIGSIRESSMESAGRSFGGSNGECDMGSSMEGDEKPCGM